MVYNLFTFSLFLTKRYFHQQTKQNVMTLFLQIFRGTQVKCFSLCERRWIFSGSTIFAGLFYIDSLNYHPTLVCHRLLYPDIYRNARFLCVAHWCWQGWVMYTWSEVYDKFLGFDNISLKAVGHTPWHKVINVTSVISFVVRQQTDKSSVVCILEVMIVWVCTSAWISVQGIETWRWYTPLRSSGGDRHMWRTHAIDIYILWAVGKETV